MSAIHRTLGPTILVVALLAAGVPASAQSPSIVPSEAPGATPAASAAAVPDDLVTGTDPAWSLVLDYNWGAIEGEDLLNAQGASASNLALRNEPLPGGATFEEDVQLTFDRLQKAAGKKTELELTFRRTGIGTVARISYPLVKAGDRAIFLFPVCEDGMRVLDVIGYPWVASTPGGPDWWDTMAAGVNPCSADPAPVLVIAPEVQELASQYLALAEDVNPRIDEAAKPIIKGTGVKGWNKAMKTIRQLRTEFRDGVTALPWTPELQPLVEDWNAAFTALIENEARIATAKKIGQIEANLGPWGDLLDGAQAASEALRLEIGLETQPR